MVNYITKAKKCKIDDSANYGSVSKQDAAAAAAEFYQKSATSFKSAKSWEQAGSTYIKLAECHLKFDSYHEAANAYVEAANCYKKTSPIQAISCLEQAVNLFSKIGTFIMAAKYCKEVGELYEHLRDLDEGIKYFKRAADYFQGEAAATSASQCKQKVAQFSAQLKQYMKAIEIFEEVAQEAVNSNQLRYGVRGHLLNAGICHLCIGDIVELTNALARYQNLDPTFSRTREYELLADLLTAYDKHDIENFTEALMDYDSLSPLDSWKTTLLLRIKENLKTKDRNVDLA